MVYKCHSPGDDHNFSDIKGS